MTPQALVALLVAAALLVAPGTSTSRMRVRRAGPAAADRESGRWLPGLAGLVCGLVTALALGGPSGLAVGLAAGVAGLVAARRLRRATGQARQGEPLVLAGAWELAAACLHAGMPLPVAVRAAARGLPGPAGRALRRTAELLALGSGPDQAWQPALECPATARVARAARRSGRSGAALASSLAELAAEVRAGARERSEARAQRAGVLITAPLGLCFLPAFLCLGVVPVVIGLAGQLLSRW